mmetsp:Transcript_122362/g.305417  ORF Transcript_122362/g.305417 Transcript_122362/m.305417 type:complete len:212 (+) Transcript_122362:324-959(+)
MHDKGASGHFCTRLYPNSGTTYCPSAAMRTEPGHRRESTTTGHDEELSHCPSGGIRYTFAPGAPSFQSVKTMLWSDATATPVGVTGWNSLPTILTHVPSPLAEHFQIVPATQSAMTIRPSLMSATSWGDWRSPAWPATTVQSQEPSAGQRSTRAFGRSTTRKSPPATASRPSASPNWSVPSPSPLHPATFMHGRLPTRGHRQTSETLLAKR